MPTTEQIHRFILAFAGHVKVHNPTGTPSIDTVRNTLSYIIANAKLKFEHFAVMPHAQAMLNPVYCYTHRPDLGKLGQ